MTKLSLSNSEIQKLIKSLGLEDVGEIQELTSGTINPVYLINNKYILRVDLGLSGDNVKFDKEVFLFKTLPELSIPVPKVIAFDDSCKVIKYPFMLMHKLSGDNLSEVYSSQSQVIKAQLSNDLGILVKKINQITADDMQNSPLLGNIELWALKLKSNFEIYWSHLKNKNFFPKNICNQIDKVKDDYCQITHWHGVGRLIHGDINPSNIKVVDNHIVGIFDFEYAAIADPLADLERLPISFQVGTDFVKKSFLDGYGVAKFSNFELVRVKMYSLSQGLWEIWATDTQAFPYGKKEMDEGKALVLGALSLTSDGMSN